MQETWIITLCIWVDG